MAVRGLICLHLPCLFWPFLLPPSNSPPPSLVLYKARMS